MFQRLKKRSMLFLPLVLLLMMLTWSAFSLSNASAATTLGAAAAQSGRVFASAISTSHLSDSQYVNTWYTEFTGFTPENEMKWDTTEPSQNSFNFSSADTLVSDAQQHNMKIRGHTLVWYSQLPGWVSSISSSSTILSVMNNHITTEMTHFKGKIWYWDVVNEAFNDDGSRRPDVFQNLLGNSYIETAFRTARSADPNAKLCYNDYNIEDMNSAKSQAVYAMVSDFKNRGVPIDCVGFQSHFIVGQIPSDFQATLQKFANLGIDVQITELDIRMPTPASTANLNQQATDYSNVTKACLAVSRCNDITVWGIPDKYSWVQGTFAGYGAPLLFDDNYNKKPAYNSTLTALNGASQVTPTPTGTPTPQSGYAVNAGGSAVGSFAADGYYSGGSTYTTTATVSTSGVANAAPASVYQTERYGNFTYTFPNLIPGTYTVRLHEAEVYWTSSGQRSFNVSINGQQVLSNFDLYTAAGGADKALVEQFTTTTDASGQITIQFTSVKDNAKVDGIEIIAGSIATPTPSPTTGSTPTPSPTTGSTPTATPTQGQGGATCSVHYAITNQWQGGFSASLTITNTGTTPINGWTLQFSFPNGQAITQLWNGSYTQSGSAVTISNASYNGTIPAGGTVTSYPGFNGTWNGTNSAPTAFTLNGNACSVA